jgi:hypothetical protein
VNLRARAAASGVYAPIAVAEPMYAQMAPTLAPALPPARDSAPAVPSRATRGPLVASTAGSAGAPQEEYVNVMPNYMPVQAGAQPLVMAAAEALYGNEETAFGVKLLPGAQVCVCVCARVCARVCLCFSVGFFSAVSLM